MKHATICECCGGVMPGAVDRAEPHLSPLMGRIVRAVARRPGITADRIADFAYADDPNGGPDNAAQSIYGTIWRQRGRLNAFGLRLVSDRGTRGFRLEGI